MTTLVQIEQQTKQYADALDVLTERVQALESELESIKRRKLRGIKEAVRKVKTIEAELHDTIEASPELFEKPRTQVISGIKVGILKSKGKITVEDDEKVVKLIRKYFSDQEDVLINTKETPVKKALGNLSAAELKRIGVTIEDTGDQVVIKSTDSNVDKLVSALLKEAEAFDSDDIAAA